MKQKILDAIFILLLIFIVFQHIYGVSTIFHSKDCLCRICEIEYDREWLEDHPEAK